MSPTNTDKQATKLAAFNVTVYYYLMIIIGVLLAVLLKMSLVEVELYFHQLLYLRHNGSCV